MSARDEIRKSTIYRHIALYPATLEYGMVSAVLDHSLDMQWSKVRIRILLLMAPEPHDRRQAISSGSDVPSDFSSLVKALTPPSRR